MAKIRSMLALRRSERGTSSFMLSSAKFGYTEVLRSILYSLLEPALYEAFGRNHLTTPLAPLHLAGCVTSLNSNALDSRDCSGAAQDHQCPTEGKSSRNSENRLLQAPSRLAPGPVPGSWNSVHRVELVRCLCILSAACSYSVGCSHDRRYLSNSH
jgi:hypothetical protein